MKVEFLKMEGAGNRKIRLLETLEIKNFFNIPAGFISDGGTIPRIFRIFFSPFGFFLILFIAHDFLYEKKLYSKWQSDILFLKSMNEHIKINAKRNIFLLKIGAFILFLSVFLFGFFCWYKKYE